MSFSISRISWEGSQLSARTREAAKHALFLAGEYVLDESNKIVPFDRGFNDGLASTGEVSSDSNGTTISVSYDKPYAVRLHEHPEYNFRDNRQGKWLEKTFNNCLQKVRAFMIDTVSKSLR